MRKQQSQAESRARMSTDEKKTRQEADRRRKADARAAEKARIEEDRQRERITRDEELRRELMSQVRIDSRFRENITIIIADGGVPRREKSANLTSS